MLLSIILLLVASISAFVLHTYDITDSQKNNIPTFLKETKSMEIEISTEEIITRLVMCILTISCSITFICLNFDSIVNSLIKLISIFII